MIESTKKKFVISLRLFNIVLFLIGLLAISVLLYNQYKYSETLIVDCFIKKKEASTKRLRNNFISLVSSHLKNLQISKFTPKIVVENGKIKTSSKYADFARQYLKNPKNNIFFDFDNLVFVKFFEKRENGKVVLDYATSSMKNDLQKSLIFADAFTKDLRIYFVGTHFEPLLKKNIPGVVDIHILDRLKKEEFIHKLDWKNKSLFYFTEAKIKNLKFVIEVEYTLDGLKETLDKIFNKLIINLFLLIIGFFIVYIFIIRNISSILIKLADNMKNRKKCKKCPSYIKELYNLAYYYNTLYDKLNEEIKHNKALLDLNKRFVVDTIHQIRTPIGVIMLNLDLLKMSVEDKEVDDIIEEIDAAVSMLSNSYEDLAYVSSNDTLDYKPAKIDLSELTKERVEFFKKIAKVSDKNLIANIEEGIEYYINKIEYERIVDNNISNAIKYSTGSDIFINLFRRDNEIYLEVASYGAPIKNRKEIFEINYREQLHKRGLGIGLNIVKNICEKYGIKYRTYYRNRQNIFEYIFPLKEEKSDSV